VSILLSAKSAKLPEGRPLRGSGAWMKTNGLPSGICVVPTYVDMIEPSFLSLSLLKVGNIHNFAITAGEPSIYH
jgi:hypothetical protein